MREFDIIRDSDNKCKLVISKQIQADLDEPLNIHDLAYYLASKNNLRYLNNEKSYVAALDFNERLIGFYLESCGNTESCETYNKEVLTFLLLSGAKYYVMFHNHPNDNLMYSDGDLKAWASLQEFTDKLGIEFKDSIIIGKSGYYSVDQKRTFEWEEGMFL